jgi:hypothetical protein
VLELTVGSSGAVTRVDRIRVTPPYSNLMADAAAAWHFDPATVAIDGGSERVAARVLVVALFRPPSFYAGPAPGFAPQTVGIPSALLPPVRSAVMPAEKRQELLTCADPRPTSLSRRIGWSLRA